jgi:hypothetical protein
MCTCRRRSGSKQPSSGSVGGSGQVVRGPCPGGFSTSREPWQQLAQFILAPCATRRIH